MLNVEIQPAAHIKTNKLGYLDLNGDGKYDMKDYQLRDW